MKKFVVIVTVMVALASCREKSHGAFTVSGEISNAPEQKIFLQEIPFGGENPIIVDSASLQKDSKFTLRSMAKEEGLYRLVLEKGGEILLVNDGKSIRVRVDLNNFKDYTVQGSDASEDIHELFNTYLKYAERINKTGQLLDTIAAKAGNDSLVTVLRGQREKQLELLKDEVRKFINNSNSPAAIYFALGSFAPQMFPAEEVKKMADNAAGRFTQHSGLAKLKSLMAVQMNQQETATAYALLNQQAPEINLPTPEGNPLALSSFRGKYVLIDFWASWCAPCRRENPNVVAVYNKYKNKNVVFLGVSLDQDKSKWVEAIAKDNLTWYHVSDLKYWNSEVVSTYQFNAIPFNVLVDPAGKIIAAQLYGEKLDEKLHKVLN